MRLVIIAMAFLGGVFYALAMKRMPAEYLPYMYAAGVIWTILIALWAWLDHCLGKSKSL